MAAIRWPHPRTFRIEACRPKIVALDGNVIVRSLYLSDVGVFRRGLMFHGHRRGGSSLSLGIVAGVRFKFSSVNGS
jgi:hypothetical protein